MATQYLKYGEYRVAFDSVPNEAITFTDEFETNYEDTHRLVVYGADNWTIHCTANLVISRITGIRPMVNLSVGSTKLCKLVQCSQDRLMADIMELEYVKNIVSTH